MIIYKTTNLINGKIYIGQDKYNNSNYMGSGKILKQAIEQYGKENFKKEILEHCTSKDLLNAREIYWIQYFNSTDLTIGYNIATGGNGGDLGGTVNAQISNTVKSMWADPTSIYNSDEYRDRLSKSQTGRIVTPETRKKISDVQVGEKAYWYGKTNTRHSLIMKSKYQSNELVPWNKGMKYDSEFRKKLSDAHKGQVPWNKGKTDIYSDDTKRRMSEAKKGKSRPDISDKLKKYYTENPSIKRKSVIDTRTDKIYTSVKDLRNELNLTEYKFKQLLSKNIFKWNIQK